MEVLLSEDKWATSPQIVANTQSAESVTVFPAGLLHGQRCSSTGGCAFEAISTHSDEGVLTATARVCQVPPQSVAVAVGRSEAQAMAACGGLPAVPAPAARVE